MPPLSDDPGCMLSSMAESEAHPGILVELLFLDLEPCSKSKLYNSGAGTV